MNEKQLTKLEIQQIFQFVEKQEIKFFDIQLEIVDHIASEIEQNWDFFPTHWTFEQKMLDVYCKGRLNLIQVEKGKAFEKWFYSYCFKYVKSFFTWPKIGVSFLLIFLVFAIISSANNPLVYGKRFMSYTLILPFSLVTIITFLWQFIGKRFKHYNMLILSAISVGLPSVFLTSVFLPLESLHLNPTITSIVIAIGYVVFLYVIVAFLLVFAKCYREYNLQYFKIA